jgi:hypothetical protein
MNTTRGVARACDEHCLVVVDVRSLLALGGEPDERLLADLLAVVDRRAVPKVTAR